jgi:hypothetical protein
MGVLCVFIAGQARKSYRWSKSEPFRVSLRRNTDAGREPRGIASPAMAAIFNLNHPAHTIHWHFIDLSVSNVIVVVLMLVVFALALAIPFPKQSADGGDS